MNAQLALLPAAAIIAASAATLCAAGALAQGAGDAAAYPARPIRLIVPFPPGGSNDIVGRFVAQRMSERMGRQTVVDNRPGADGIVGTEQAVRAPADGYTLLVVSASYTMNPAIHKVSYDPARSLVPIAQIGTGPNVIATSPGHAAKSIAGLIALAKAKPGDVRYGSSGIGGYNHFGGELFNHLANVKLEHIPFRGGAASMIDAMAGRVDVVVGTLVQTLTHLRSGKLVALGVGSQKRSSLIPDVPTIAETVPGYDCANWWGIVAPAGIPAPIIEKLNGEINAILREPDMAKRLQAEAAEPVAGTPADFGRLIESSLAKWARVAKDAGIRAE